MRIPFLRQIVLAGALGLGACANNPPPMGPPPEIVFTNQRPFLLGVARIEIVDKFTPSSAAPHIEMEIGQPPERVIRRWVQDRLKPRGTAGTLRVVINDASATSVQLPAPKGASELFGPPASTKVDMAVDVTLQMLDAQQFVLSEVTGKAARSRTIPGDVKLNQRDDIIRDMVADLVAGLDSEVDPQIRATFGQWLLTQ